MHGHLIDCHSRAEGRRRHTGGEVRIGAADADIERLFLIRGGRCHLAQEWTLHGEAIVQGGDLAERDHDDIVRLRWRHRVNGDRRTQLRVAVDDDLGDGDAFPEAHQRRPGCEVRGKARDRHHQSHLSKLPVVGIDSADVRRAGRDGEEVGAGRRHACRGRAHGPRRSGGNGRHRDIDSRLS